MPCNALGWDDPVGRARPLARYQPLFARVSAALDDDPDAWRPLWDDPALRAIAYIGVPAAGNPHPFADAGLGADACDYPLHLAIVERLARGGASALLALPSSSLSTSVVLRLGTPEQVARFFAPFMHGPAWAFFAVTERECGSDAANCRAELSPAGDGWRLDGVKTLVGGAARAVRGLVLARVAGTERRALALIEGAADGMAFRVEPLLSVGLRGAGLCTLRFAGHALPAGALLGAGGRLPAMTALAGVFERHRPMVGAMALGTARAILDCLALGGVGQPALAGFRAAHRALLARMVGLGRAVAAGRVEAHAVSLFKRQAVRLADQARAACPVLAPELLAGDPDLRRLCRDAGAFEYMEGTSNIHLLASYRAYAAGRPGHDRDHAHAS